MCNKRPMLFYFIFFIFICVCDASAVESDLGHYDFDTSVISMDFKDAGLKDILKVLSVQSGLNFIASESVQDRKMTLYMDKVPIEEAMNKIFKANNLSYEMDEDSNIFIVKEWGKTRADTITRVFSLKYAMVTSSPFNTEATSQLKSGAPIDLITSLKNILSASGKLSEDTRTNSIIVTDTPDVLDTVAQVIAKLDTPVPQVVIDVEMLDVKKDIVDSLGFEFDKTPFAMLAPNASFKNGFQYFFGDIRTRGKGSLIAGLPKDGGTNGVITWGNMYGQVLNFLRTQTDTKYLARPKLLTLNNQTAEISITRDEVVGTKSTTVSGTTTSTNIEYVRSTDLALTGEGTGVFLRVTPQINLETGEVTMIINPKSSTTSVSTLSNTQADAEVRSSKSMVKVRDGETIALGGLIHQEKNVQVKKLPILSDIPILGALFRNKDVTKNVDRELLVFITPHIMKDSKVANLSGKRNIVLSREQNYNSTYERKVAVNSSLDKFENLIK